jgi:hypothetical protein
MRGDEYLEGQHRLGYFIRGPEWAFVLPQGDLEALDDVVRTCSTLWNGVGSLLIGIDRAGRQAPTGSLLSARPVDTVWLHPALGDRARAAASAAFPNAEPMHELFDAEEVHSLLLGPRSLASLSRAG